jgi:hypothetical protein
MLIINLAIISPRSSHLNKLNPKKHALTGRPKKDLLKSTVDILKSE